MERERCVLLSVPRLCAHGHIELKPERREVLLQLQVLLMHSTLALHVGVGQHRGGASNKAVGFTWGM